MSIVFRNDDLSRFTDLNQFRQVHELFIRYKTMHTVAVICRDLDQHTELIDYINNNRELIDIQFHCADHVDFTLNIPILNEQFEYGKTMLKKVFGVMPTVYYPTWNKVNAHTMDIAQRHGLETSYLKVSMEYYLKHLGSVMYPVVNFHSWHEPERFLLEPCLKIYKS